MKNSKKFSNLLKVINTRDSKRFSSVKFSASDLEWFDEEHEKALKDYYEGIKVSRLTHRGSEMKLISIHWRSRVVSKNKTRYIRLLSYINACKVQNYISKKFPKDYSYIVVGGLATQVTEENWKSVEEYINSLTSSFEVSFDHPVSITNNY